MSLSPDAYRRAMEFAAKAHGDQKVPGTSMPYLVHLASVATEIIATHPKEPFDVELAVTLALLHDTLEDTNATEEELKAHFGAEVTSAVRALSKNATLPKAEQMADSLKRIREQPRETWMVKLADRISNLGPPPSYWTQEKRAHYQREATFILEQLGEASPALAARLQFKITQYTGYLT